MSNLKQILQFHTQNLKIYTLIESATTRLEHEMFDSMINFSDLEIEIPTQPIFMLCMQHNTIQTTIGSLQYHIKIEAVLYRLKQFVSIGVDEMANAILDELQDIVAKRFILGE